MNSSKKPHKGHGSHLHRVLSHIVEQIKIMHGIPTGKDDSYGTNSHDLYNHGMHNHTMNGHVLNNHGMHNHTMDGHGINNHRMHKHEIHNQKNYDNTEKKNSGILAHIGEHMRSMHGMQNSTDSGNIMNGDMNTIHEMDEHMKGGHRQNNQIHGDLGIEDTGEKAKNFKRTMKKLFGYLGAYKHKLVAVIFLAIGSTAFSIAGPKILGTVTTEIFNGLVSKIGGTGSINFVKIGEIVLSLLGIYIISALLSFITGIVMTGISQDLTYKLRKEVSEKINRIPIKYFESRTYGEVLSRVTNDIDTVSQSLNQSITQVITSATMIIGIMAMMLSISTIMTLAALLVLPVSMITMITIVKKSQKYFNTQQEYLGYVNGQVEEVYSGHNIVKAFNKEDEVVYTFDKMNHILYNSAKKSQFFSGIIIPIISFLGNLGYVVVAVLGGYLTIKKTIEVGDIQSFLQYSKNFNDPIHQVAQVVNLLQSTSAASERVFEFLEEAEEPACVTQPVLSKELNGNVEFKHVNFGYEPEKTIINDFSCKVKEGQKIAIVGPTGAGKTTMIKLLMRFYDVNKGAILIDGHDIKNFERNELHQMFGMVLQDTWLFNGSIKENIRYGKLNATDEEIIAAAKAAHAQRFIQTLPEGYNMILNEETSNISQGQKQLLTIARAILADPKILILDEATSSVDTRTEIQIQKAMDNLMKGRTSFIIAHRLSTIRDADLILVMKDGDIAEQGTHEELLKKNGLYANLYNSQFERVGA